MSPLRPSRSVLALMLSVGACAGASTPLPPPAAVPEPPAHEVERVLFLAGDPGEATTSRSPLLHALRADVEAWSDRLGRDSAVAVLVLGDIVYPGGLHPPDSEEFTRDTVVVMSQVRVVSGPHAREHASWMYFIPGNHDWGYREDFEGYVRLARLAAFLDSAQERSGAPVRLAPEAGSGGPFVLDWGTHLRLLLLDTAWWLLHAEDDEKHAFLRELEAAMRTAGERRIVLAAHHPFESVGAHGGTYSSWEMLGVGYVLRRSGAILQSLNSRPYRDLVRALRDIFARHGRPFAFIGGHDHSLQLLGKTESTDPEYGLVSGSTSKLTEVRFEPGVLFARSAPGYMRLLVLTDGGMHLSIVAAPERFLLCPEHGAEASRCMSEGVAAFEIVHSQPLRADDGR